MAAFFILFIMFIICIAILGSVFWIWMLIDCINNKRLTDTTKAVWVLVIIFTHFIGALCYLLVGRNQQQQQPPIYSPYQQPSPFQQPNGGMYQPGPPQQAGHPLYQAPGFPPPQPTRTQNMPHTSYYAFTPPASVPPAIPQAPYQQGYQPQPATPDAHPALPAEHWQQEDEPQATYPELPQQEMQ